MKKNAERRMELCELAAKESVFWMKTESPPLAHSRTPQDRSPTYRPDAVVRRSS
jgi:hypothetical protein